PLIRRQMQNEFLRLQKLLDRTIVFITHDIHEAFRLADRIAVMRDGKIVQIGTPADIALRPADGYVANFMEDVALTHVLTVGDLASGPEGECCEGLPELAGDAALDDAMRLFMTGTERLRVAGTNRVLTKDVAAQVFAGCRQTESEA
ncbi:MAG: glycine betaine/L-proline ABC transporter ATP-binding protein, partial [Pararhizobium sp.]